MVRTEGKFMADRASYKEMVELYNQGFNRLEHKIDTLGTKIDNVDDKVELVHIQATKTNGRVTVCETNQAYLLDWNHQVNQMIKDLQMKNADQDKQIQITSKDIAIITIKVSAILSVIGFAFYLVTGFVI